MSKGEVIDFAVLRIQSELEVFEKTNTIPHSILDGTWDLLEIRDHYYTKLSPEYQKIADKIFVEYTENLDKNFETLKVSLRKEYGALMSTLATEHKSFMFEKILIKYRKGFNPIKSLYYEAREIRRRFNAENEHHLWLYELLTDKTYNTIIIDALEKDVKRIERILKRYHYPFVKHGSGIPLELFHAKQLQKDFKYFWRYFSNMDQWQLDE